jgi:hypothetical protein
VPIYSLCYLASVIPLSALVLDAPQTAVALYGLLITTAAGLIGQWISYKNAQSIANNLEKQRQWDIDDRRAHREEIAAKIDENTAITKSAVIAAADAYHEANNVNEKIAALNGKAVALLNLQRAQTATLKTADAVNADTNITTHRIEDQVS